ncbi:helix-turn-helix domain-containing protein [Bernardetia sp. ABR2-2B]|uniref:helix-turn-helix domain-containing protein n=1 Tax=Bernardetia sp. ABR2-2B TaxID=3127472 RepID=UPI0030CBD585
MKFHFEGKSNALDSSVNGFLDVSVKENSWIKKSELEGVPNYALVWNRGEDNSIKIDNEPFLLEKNTVLPLMVNQHVEITTAQDLIIWEFNREFYCIVDHDKEVSCVGFLFYGMREQFLIKLSEEKCKKFDNLYDVFVDEYDEKDDIQGEMLRMLLKRLIIKVTRIARKQYLDDDLQNNPKLDLIREYNLLVELNFKKEHQVQFYAEQLFKSPKTLSNLFAKYSSQTPSKIIQNRIIEEAKRLLKFTDKTTKEIAFELGFDNYSHFSKFFKRMTKLAPTFYRERL